MKTEKLKLTPYKVQDIKRANRLIRTMQKQGLRPVVIWCGTYDQ